MRFPPLPWVLACGLMGLVTAGAEEAPPGISCLPPVQAWHVTTNSLPGQQRPSAVPDGVMFPVDFHRMGDRLVWDADVALDLQNRRYFEAELSVQGDGDPRYLSLYFHSSNGWYGTTFSAPVGTHYRVKLVRTDFREEDRPAGWARIDRVRLTVWRGDNSAPTKLTLHSIRAEPVSVFVVWGSTSVPLPGRGLARDVARQVSRWLSQWGVPHDVLTEERFVAGEAYGARLAILPYNTNPDELLMRALQRFSGSGGRLVVCYGENQDLAQHMGFRLGRYKEASSRGQWSAYTWESGAADPPLRVVHETQNILAAVPESADARVCAWWESANGQREEPAWLVSPQGWWMTHIPSEQDASSQAEVFLRMVCEVVPEYWHRAGDRIENELEFIQPWGSWKKAIDDLAARPGGTNGQIIASLDGARAAHDNFLRLRGAGRDREAVGAAREARHKLADAWAGTLHRPSGEFAVWDSLGIERPEEDLPSIFAALADAGVKQVFFNIGSLSMLTLTGQPVSDRLRVAAEIAQAKGIHLYAWAMVWSLHTFKPGVVDELSRTGRLQEGRGGEGWPWMCPEKTGNMREILQALESLSRTPGLSGIHMDYVRYCEKGPCLCDASRRTFENDVGHAVTSWPADVQAEGVEAKAFDAWRVSRMNLFVRIARDRIKGTNPSLRVSASVFADYPACCKAVGQDWAEWVRRGWIDFVCPMAYHGSLDHFQNRMKTAARIDGARDRVWAGIGVSSGEETGPLDVLARIEAARNKGLNNAAIFALDPVFMRDVLPLLKNINAGNRSRPEESEKNEQP